jgi:hypothetical protein
VGHFGKNPKRSHMRNRLGTNAISAARKTVSGDGDLVDRT